MKILNLGSTLDHSIAYDLFIAALGFESRATAVAEKLAFTSKRKFALGFNHNQVLAHHRNLAWFKNYGAEVIPNLDENQFIDAVFRILNEVKSSDCIRIAIDISCFDRQRLAALIDAIWVISQKYAVCIDFVYCIAAFREPSATVGRNEIAGPVHRSFAGRFLEPGRPLAMIAGLGYEPGKVIGAAEYLQASRVIALFPLSPLTKYEPEVRKANHSLFEELSDSDVIRYPVDDCRKTVATLDSIVRGLRDTHNVVLLPGGPKIFVLASLITQRMHRQISVWRVSSGSSINARDVQPSEHFVATRLTLEPP